VQQVNYKYGDETCSIVLNPSRTQAILHNASDIMKYISPLLALSAVASAAHFSKEQYESGEVHQRIIDMKNVCCETRLSSRCVAFADMLPGSMGCTRSCWSPQQLAMAVMERLETASQ
jgi:hypothetical protein